MVHAFLHPISHCEDTNTYNSVVFKTVIFYLRPSMPYDRMDHTWPGRTNQPTQVRKQEKAKRNHTKPNPDFSPVISGICESFHTEGIGPEASIIFSTIVLVSR
ncbi:hypothetical protein ASPBRDRAFT_57740 [Aspergillus brasiliensis CBS 101740]|uniref:Uncharacterized protein n=1 Tax=Aspergillus brasiliensis (strain CBS 101740 / IMI 381727 / IBT 21946) TaxID=767769 RepID=A0A1L9UBZ0_ASPBC|nr:hypothetical protein ASPBRDRAFT_57740 [Aspergillus brasiliensis CBS 101740]